MANELVSVIMPVYNAEAFVAEAINSVLNQSYERLELLVIDDASTDESMKIINDIRDPRLNCIYLDKNGGAGVARNKGIRLAKGRYIAFIDADDLWLREKLEKQLEFMRESKASLSYSDYYLMNEDSKFTHHVASPPWLDRASMLKNNYIGCLTAIYDTRELGKIFMPERRKRQDWALWLDILNKVDRAYGLQIPLAAYRQSSNSLSRNKLKLIRENFRFYREVLGYNRIAATVRFIRFLGAYSWYKINSVKSID